MALSEKRKASNRKSDANTYEYKNLKIRKEWDFCAVVKMAADMAGESLNGFMIKAIRDKVEAAGFTFPVPVLPDKEEK